MTTPGIDNSVTDTKPASSPKAAMFIVFLVVFIDLLGFGIVLPLLPRYSSIYLGVIPEDFHGATLGILFSIFSLMQFFFSPMWGRLSDRIGRRPVLLISLSGSVVFYGLFGAASDIPASQSWLALGLLFFSRLGAGVAGASVSTAAAVIADCTPPDKRARGMALIGAAFGFGFTFGPLIGYLGLTIFDQAHWAPGAFASLLSFGALLLAIRLLPETRVAGKAPARKELISISRTREVLRMPTIGSLVLIYFLAIFGFANFEGTLSVFTEAAFQLDERSNFLIFAYIGLVLMIAQGGFYRRLAGKMSEERLLAVGAAMMLLGLAGLAAVAWMAGQGKDVSTLEVSFYCALAVSVFGFAFVNPSVTALVSKRSDPGRQGEVLGVNQSFASLGRILGPLIGLILFKLGLSHTLPYLAGVATLIVVVLLLPRVRGKEIKNT
jgi:DHA1 family tetracycline resistance protein-like MFS transporter